MKALATFETQHSSRYLEALCHHFARKVEAVCEPTQGSITFSFGQCALAAQTHQLEIVAEADDPTQLAQVEDVITRHLERFAFRENPQLIWRPVTGSET